MLGKLISELNTRGADFVKIVDVSMLKTKENQGFTTAVLIGMALSPGFIMRMTEENITGRTEFDEKEDAADRLAEWAADFIEAKGFRAFAQSEDNLSLHGLFDEATKTSVLPHKKLAVMAGLGWIGENNLLVTREYGCALCMCSILTDAPLSAENRPAVSSQCCGCTICKDICPAGVIHGTKWEPGMNRDLIVDVYHCITCLKCLINCPWTQGYMKKFLNGK